MPNGEMTRALAVCALAIAGCASSPATPPSESAPTPRATITATPWGTADGKPVTLYTLTNSRGLVLKVATYGGIITELDVPDRAGNLADVVLGFDRLEPYLKGSPYFGAIIGRVANRIQGAHFELAGKQYTLAANNGQNSLHGGNKGWDKVVWEAKPEMRAEGPTLRLTYRSRDGEEGYPGTVEAVNTYTLSNANELVIGMSATTDQLTVVSMAHHTYWNLAGQASGTILDQELEIDASHYTPIDPTTQTPNGTIAPVAGTPFDFRIAKPIGKDLLAAGGSPLGFDGNWALDGDPHALRKAVRVKDPKSGRVLTLSGDQPGLQFYSGNYLDGTVRGKGGASYPQYGGFCIETQKFPNAINVPAWSAEVKLEPGQSYGSRMVFAFSTE